MKTNYSQNRLMELDRLCRNIRLGDAFWGDAPQKKEQQALRLHAKAQGIVATQISRMTGRFDSMGDMLIGIV